MAEKLGMGSSLPEMSFELAGGGSIDLPGGLGERYRVILFYRGHW